MSTELTIFKPSPQPVAMRHRPALSRHKLHGSPLVIPDNQPLIPSGDCEAIIAEMDQALMGMDAIAAKELAQLILGSYPNSKPDNPDAYVQSITIACQCCPSDLNHALYKEVINREVPFAPVANEIIRLVGEITRKRSAAKAIAKAHQREWTRRGDSTDRVTPETIAALKEKYPEAFGIAKEMPLAPEERMGAITKDAIRAGRRAMP